MQKNYTKEINSDRLSQEIRLSAITVALDYINTAGTSVNIFFKADLSESEITLLDAILASHVNTPLPSAVTKVEVTSTPAIASKTLSDGKKIYERVVGVKQQVEPVAEGHLSDTINYTVPYPHAKLIGLHIINCTALDTVDLEVFDTAAGTYSGYPNLKLNQFGFATNMPKDFFEHKANFDADVYQGLIIRITYKSSTSKMIGINFIMNEVKAT